MKKLVVLCVALCAARASAEPLAETVARFEKLGMPNVAGSEYARLIWPLGNAFEVAELGGCGNAWKMSEEARADGKRVGTFIVNGAEIVNVEWMDQDTRRWTDVGTAPSADWEHARLKRAVVQISDVLEQRKPPPHKGLNPGQLFLFVLQLHQFGETEDAETLMRLVDKTFGNEAAESAAVDIVFLGRYKTAWWRFAEHGSWARFYTDLDTLANETPDPSRWFFGICGLRDYARTIAFEGGTALPQSYDFTDAQRALIRDLEAFNVPFFYTRRTVWRRHDDRRATQTLWCVPDAWMHSEDAVVLSHAEREIRAMGMDAIPMLAALCRGTPLIKSSGLQPCPEGLRNQASRILGDMLPPSYKQQTKYGSRAETAAAFYEKFKDALPETIAFEYAFVMNHGTREINEKAFDFLRRRAHEKETPEIEVFLATVDLNPKPSSFQPYYNGSAYMHNLIDFAVYYAAARNDDEMLKFMAMRVDTVADVYKVTSAGRGADWVKSACDMLHGISANLRAVSTRASNAALWDMFKVNAEKSKTVSPHNDYRNRHKSDSIDYTQIILAARLDAMPFRDAYLEILKNTVPEKSEFYMHLLLRRIKTEGGFARIKTMISPTDGCDDWLRIVYGEPYNLHRMSGLDFYTRIFEDIEFDPPDENIQYQIQHFLRLNDTDTTVLKKRTIARLDGVPENDLPKIRKEK